MQFAIAVTLLLTVSAAYLLHQFWSRELVDDGSVPEIDAATDVAHEDDALRAA